MTEVERLRKALEFYADEKNWDNESEATEGGEDVTTLYTYGGVRSILASNEHGWEIAKAALVPTLPESRDTPPRHKDREKAWEAFKVDWYGTTNESGIVPSVRFAFDFAWDAAVAGVAAGGAAGATTAAIANVCNEAADSIDLMARAVAGEDGCDVATVAAQTASRLREAAAAQELGTRGGRKA